MVGVVVVFIFFFFKQKTAYEMRISDWSSDVCSSDLGESARSLLQRNMGFRKGATFRVSATTTRYASRRQLSTEQDEEWSHEKAAWFHRERPGSGPRPRTARRRPRQIGRASGRERVCQYV